MADTENIFRITKDIVRARDLFQMANERYTEIIKILPRDKPYKIIEEYYEIIVQLITGLMYSDGLKTLSHLSLINYLKEYPAINNAEVQLINSLRKFRHGTVYYGKKIGGEFLVNNEEEIKRVVDKLINLLKI